MPSTQNRVLTLRECTFCGLRHLRYGDWVVCEGTRNVISPQGVVTRKVEPQACRLLIILLLRRGKMSNPTAIADGLWEDVHDQPNYWRNVISTQIGRLQKFVTIKNHFGQGWEITHGG